MCLVFPSHEARLKEFRDEHSTIIMGNQDCLALASHSKQPSTDVLQLLISSASSMNYSFYTDEKNEAQRG